MCCFIVEGVVFVSFFVGFFVIYYENDLVGGISYWMDSFGEYWWGFSKCLCDGFCYCDCKVGGGSCDDCFVVFLCWVGWFFGFVWLLSSVCLVYVIFFRWFSLRVM